LGKSYLRASEPREASGRGEKRGGKGRKGRKGNAHRKDDSVSRSPDGRTRRRGRNEFDSRKKKTFLNTLEKKILEKVRTRLIGVLL